MPIPIAGPATALLLDAAAKLLLGHDVASFDALARRLLDT